MRVRPAAVVMGFALFFTLLPASAQEPSGADLAVELGEPSGFRVGELGTLPTYLVNVGAASATDAGIAATFDVDSSSRAAVAELAPGERALVGFSFAPVSCSLLTFAFLADPDELLAEPDEENNRLMIAVDVVPGEVPGRPAAPRFHAGEDETSVVLTMPPPDCPTPTLDFHRVLRRDPGEASFHAVADVAGPTYEDEGLAPGVYEYRVVAFAGDRASAEGRTATVQVPITPPDLAVTPEDDFDLHVGAFGSIPARFQNLGGTPLAQASVWLSSSTGHGWGATAYDFPASHEAWFNASLVPTACERVTLTWRADPDGLVAESDESNNAAQRVVAVQPGAIPGRPAAPQARATEDGGGLVVTMPAPNCASPAIARQTLYRSGPQNLAAFFPVAEVFGAEHLDADLAPGEYAYKVVAHGGDGASAASPAATARVWAPPGAPVDFMAQPGASLGSVALSWQHAPDGGRALVGYHLARIDPDGERHEAWLPPDATSHADQALEPAQAYRYELVADNGRLGPAAHACAKAYPALPLLHAGCP